MLRLWSSAPGPVFHRVVAPILRRLGSPKHLVSAVNLDGDLPVFPPEDVVLALGKGALGVMQRAGAAPKGRAIPSLRERIFQPHPQGARFLVTHDPRDPESEPSTGSELAWDVALAQRLLTTGSLDPALGEYRWVPDFSELVQAVEARFALTGKAVPVACDSETLGLSPFIAGGRIIAIGFTMTCGTADCVHIPSITSDEQAQRVHGQVEWLLTSPKVKLRLANAKFDLMWLRVLWGIRCTNLSFDTLLAGSLLDENRSNSLETHTKVYASDLGGYDRAFNQDVDKSRMDLVPPEKLLPYLGGDVDATLRVSEAQIPELLSQPGLLNLYQKVLLPASETFLDIEEEGMLVDQEAFAELRSDLELEIAKLEKQALDLLPYRLRFKYADNLSLSRPAVLQDYFFSPMGLNLKPIMLSEKTQKPSTAKHHLEMFAHVPEAQAMCAILSDLNQARKVHSTYVVGFLKHLRADGRFHPTFLLHAGKVFDHEDDDGGTTTGRLAATAPAVQTIPKRNKWAKRIRKCYVAPPGYLMGANDYEQGELKIAACLAEEPTMIEAYRQGVDLHVKTAAGIANVSVGEFMGWKEDDPDKYELVRNRGKVSNFGLIYGMSADGLQAYAWQGYRLRLSLMETTAIRTAFFDTYQALDSWYERSKAFVHKHGYVVSPLGRVRRLPMIRSYNPSLRSEAERQAINAPVQSCLSEMLVAATNLARRELPDLRPIATVHDQLIWVAREDKAHETAKAMTELMANLPLQEDFGWSPALTFTADAEVGQSLGALTKLKF